MAQSANVGPLRKANFVGVSYGKPGGYTKMEIWNITNSPERFQTSETWPKLFGWTKPHLFIVLNSFFPEH